MVKRTNSPSVPGKFYGGDLNVLVFEELAQRRFIHSFFNLKLYLSETEDA